MVTTQKEILTNSCLFELMEYLKKNMEVINHGAWYYEMQELGYNYRLTDIQATLGITQLAKNPKGVDRRNEIAEHYKKAFKGLIKHQSLPEGMLNAHHLFVIEVDDRIGLYEHLKSKGIYTQIHYIPVHTLPYYRRIGYEDADLTNAENYYQHCLSLPMYPTLTKMEQDFVILEIKNSSMANLCIIPARGGAKEFQEKY